jgi:uncharacterized membrane protein YcaP (DUF421 family)
MEIVLRATIIFWLLWVLLRVAGKRELAEMTPFEFIILMVMGDLIQQAVTEEDMSLTGGSLAVSTILLWTLLFSYLSYRSRRVASYLESAPVILVTDGRVDEDMLDIQRLSLDDLLDEARNVGIGDLGSVRWAVLEADGKISFVRTDRAETRSDDDTAA